MLTILRRSLLLLALLLAASVAYTAAFLLRFEFYLPPSEVEHFRVGLGIFLAIKMAAYSGFRLHTIRWRFAGMYDLCRIALANLTASALVYLVTVAVAGSAFPRSIYILDAVLCFLATAAIPFSVRLYREVFLSHAAACVSTKTVLIYGAGFAGRC